MNNLNEEIAKKPFLLTRICYKEGGREDHMKERYLKLNEFIGKDDADLNLKDLEDKSDNTDDEKINKN